MGRIRQSELEVKTMATLQYTMMACQDCLVFIANGDEPEDSDWCAELISAHIGRDSGFVCCGDSDQDDEFSWSPCECCGSQLGGSRHQLCVVR
jgi:hypothetical protein